MSPIPLSPRQIECVSLVVAGLGNRQAAEKLGLSPRTFETHLQESRRRMGARTRGHMVAMAVNSGLLGSKDELAAKFTQRELSAAVLGLKPIDLEILACLSKGMQDKEIGRELNLSQFWIKDCRRKLLKAACVRHPFQLGVWALRNRLVP